LARRSRSKRQFRALSGGICYKGTGSRRQETSTMLLLTRRGALRAGLATPAAAALPGAALAQASPTAQGAGFYRFRLGDLRCAVVSDGSLTIEAPVQASLAINATPEAVAATLAERFLPADRGTLHFNALLIETAERKVLVDTGSRSAMGPSTGKLIANLRFAGVAPEQIDTVVISHAHPDHLFGVLDAAGALAFPAAWVLVGGAEHAFWTGDADLSRSPIDPSLKRMVTDGAREHLGAIAARLELVGPDRELAPGLTAVATPGHTPGHLSFLLASGGAQLFVTHDVVHHFGTALPHPEWKVAFDTDPDLAVETRKRVLDRVATDRAPVLAYHFPFPGLGHVARRTGGYAWEPVPWSWDPDAPLG
jgi:glyoxylase-like metal-dependent hydrolase (beta-lactamase superfamily II)